MFFYLSTFFMALLFKRHQAGEKLKLLGENLGIILGITPPKVEIPQRPSAQL
jgi:hypothetical protein